MGFTELLRDPAMVESLFFASATAPPAGALLIAGDRDDMEPLPVAVLGTSGFAAVDELIVVVGLRAEAVVVVALEGEPCVEEARDVLLAAVADFFSSMEDIDGVGLWLVLEAVGAVALLAVLRTAEPASGRVGGLLNPPVVRVVDAAVPLVAEDAGTVPGRLAPMTVRFGRTFSFLGMSFLVPSFSVSVSTPEVNPAASSPETTSTGVSSGTTSVTWWSAILNMDLNLSVGRPQSWCETVIRKYLVSN